MLTYADVCLPTSAGVRRESFKIKSISPGSVIVEAEIYADPSGGGPEPAAVALGLEQQASDPNSPLRRGKLLSYCYVLCPHIKLLLCMCPHTGERAGLAAASRGKLLSYCYMLASSHALS